MHYPTIFDLLQMSKFMNVKILRVSVLDSINGLGSLAEPLVRGLGASEAESLFYFGRLRVHYFAVFIRFSGV